MTRRIGLLLVGALASAAALPGCANPQKQTVVDPSWYLRDPEPVSEPEAPKNTTKSNQKADVFHPAFEREAPKNTSKSNRIWKDPELPDLKFVPPRVDPPPSDPHQGPKLEEKSVSAKPTSLPKDPPMVELPPLNSPPGQALRNPPPTEALALALQCMLDNRHPEALEHLKKYDPATQEVFIRLLAPMAEMCKKPLEKLTATEVAALYEQLEALKTVLRTRTELAIDQMCFCKSIKAYGVYERLPENHAFNAGAPNRPGDLVQLYVEVRNFASELHNGWFETRLASTVEILDIQGKQVWFKNFEDNKKPYLSKTQLHDYYNNYRFYVPHLPAGNYTLKLQIVDEARPETRRLAYKTLDFRVTTLPR